MMNASNEVAVALFLQERIHFTGIMDLIENVMDNHKVHMNPSIDDIIEIDGWSREETMRIYNRDYSRNATIKANYKRRADSR